MALVLADRVLETTTTTGSGTITLAGAEPGYQSFSVVGNANQTYYTIAGDTEWEVGIGTYTSSGTTLSRDTVLSSSAGGAKVTLSAGQKKVFVTYPSEKSVNFGVSGNISASSGVITDVGYPSADSDAATKLYVDNMSSAALHIHEAVVLTTPADTGRADTYNNGTAGVSATLTATANGTLVIDSTVAQSAQRVLIKDCTNQVQNGIYVVTTVGTASTPYVMTRSSDADTYGEGGSDSLDLGSYFFTTGGTTQKGAAYVCNTPGVIVFGSTAITFAEFSQAQVYSAGNGISITLGSIALNTPVTVASGGTGLTTSPTNGQLLIGNGSNYTLSTLTAGSGVSITNSAGSITLSATGLGGTVTAVTASGPLASSGGTTPNISVANSTGTGSVVLDQGATISSATITAAVSASITTITGSSANITTITGTTAGFSSAAITQLSATSAGITTVSGTTTTFSSGTITQFGATSATIATVSGTNVTYSNGNLTSATVTNLSSTSANITTLTGTTFGTTATTHLKGISGTITTLTGTSADITTITGTTIGTTASATIRGISGAITTISGTTATYTSATVTNLALTSLTLANLSITSANVTTLTGTNLTYTSGTVTNLNSTSANITTLTGTTFGTTATTQLRGASADITTLTGTTFGTTATTQLRGASGQITTLTATSSNITTLTGTTYTFTSGTIYNPTLGGTQGNTKDWLTLQTSTSNADFLKLFKIRTSTGSDWTTAGSRIQQQVDSTWHGYIQFNGDNSEGITFGTGGSTVGPLSIAERMRIDNSGRVGIGKSPTTILDVSGTITGTTVSATTGTFTSGTITNLNSTSANITTLTGTTFGTTATTQLRGASAQITTISATTIGSTTGTTVNASTVNVTTTGTTINSNGDIYAVRSGGTTGVIFLGNSGTRYLYFDGSNYHLATNDLYIKGVQAVVNSGTWSINVTGSSGSTTGNAATVTDGMYLASTQTSGGRKSFSAGQASGSLLNATGSLGGLEAVTLGGANAAFMSFHRAGAYASYFGIDTDNQFAVGGWSAGAALANFKCLSLGVGTAASGTSGEIRATNNITAYYSDARLKDFKGKIGDALYKVSQLNGYYYTENEKAEEFGFKNKELQVGVSAQEVKAILPEVIAPAPFDMDAENKSKSGEDYMTVRYEKLVPLLIEAIKELKAEVEALKAAK